MVSELNQRVPPPAVINRQLGMVCRALQVIHDQYGKTCDDYPACSHRGCIDSYEAWALAEQTLVDVRTLAREGSL